MSPIKGLLLQEQLSQLADLVFGCVLISLKKLHDFSRVRKAARNCRSSICTSGTSSPSWRRGGLSVRPCARITLQLTPVGCCRSGCVYNYCYLCPPYSPFSGGPFHVLVLWERAKGEKPRTERPDLGAEGPRRQSGIFLPLEQICNEIKESECFEARVYS